MTSFDYARACSVCHAGGGPLEYDREGNRYDTYLRAHPELKNQPDGDYYQSRWDETGVMEVDCLMCHLPTYDNERRKEQIVALNFCFAATAGAGFGKVIGEVAKGERPKLVYEKRLFGEDGKVTLNMVKEVPTRNCLFCHQETDWKKKGAGYNPRMDVHIRANLRCIDCHLTGSQATDERIKGKEVHQIGKGNCPGGFVRDNLDNTMRTCQDCHSKGLINAPLMKHRSLPPHHLEVISCQACHIPNRQVKAALIQDSTVFNTTPRIKVPPKRIWSFYGPNAKPWNYYGEADTYTAKYQPLHNYPPVVGWYKGKIYPMTRLYSIWLGIEEEGKKGLNQPFMKDMFKMWTMHQSDPNKFYSELKVISDDNQDGFLEVNRPEEIKAIISGVTEYLKQQGRLSNKQRVVFVKGNLVTADGINWRVLEKRAYEYSPYGSVFKFSHDISPSKAALGTNGCQDCHSANSAFFFKDILVDPFNEKGKKVFEPSYKFLGISPKTLAFSLFLHQTFKPLSPWLLLGFVLLLIFHYILFGPKRMPLEPQEEEVIRFNRAERVIHYVSLVSFLGLSITGLVTFFGIPFTSNTISTIHTCHHYFGYTFLIGVIFIFFMWCRDACFSRYDKEWLKKLGGYLGYKEILPANRFNAGQKLFFWFILLVAPILGITGLVLIYTKAVNVRLVAATVHHVTAIITIIGVLLHLYLTTLANPGTLRGIFEGKVYKTWVRIHHPLWKKEKR